MEKTIVIYANKYDSTEKYAHWIGEELDCPVIELSKATKSGLDDYDTIIYGGGKGRARRAHRLQSRLNGFLGNMAG